MATDPNDPFYKLGRFVGIIICIILAATLVALALNFAWKVLMWTV